MMRKLSDDEIAKHAAGAKTRSDKPPKNKSA
jgi:hypothetical protein